MTQTAQEKLSYQIVLDALLRMHQLFVEGKRQSEEVARLRDDIDDPYSDLTNEQREEIEGLSTDLFDVEKIVAEPVLDDFPLAEKKVMLALNALQESRYDEALRLLRDSKNSKPFSRISYYRGRVWEEKNHPEIALVFFNHAVLLAPKNDIYLAAALSSLCDAYPERGMIEVDRILTQCEEYAPFVIIRACEIKFDTTLKLDDENKLRPVYEQIVRALHIALDIMRRGEKPILISEAQPMYGVVCALVATCCRNMGMIDAAFHYYTTAIGLDPLNAALLVARGSVLYGRNILQTQYAIEDFERALAIGSDLAIPYYFISHSLLHASNFKDCLRAVEDGLKKRGTKRLRSEMLEFRAIALAALDQPPDLVIATFKEAQSEDETNKRTTSNLEIYKDMLRRKSAPMNETVQVGEDGPIEEHMLRRKYAPMNETWMLAIDVPSLLTRDLPKPPTLREALSANHPMAA